MTAGEKLHLTGWGKTQDDKINSNIMQKVIVSNHELDFCKNHPNYKDYNVYLNASLQLCVGGEDGKDSCAGDSGGPLGRDH